MARAAGTVLRRARPEPRDLSGKLSALVRICLAITRARSLSLSRVELGLTLWNCTKQLTTKNSKNAVIIYLGQKNEAFKVIF